MGGDLAPLAGLHPSTLPPLQSADTLLSSPSQILPGVLTEVGEKADHIRETAELAGRMRGEVFAGGRRSPLAVVTAVPKDMTAACVSIATRRGSPWSRGQERRPGGRRFGFGTHLAGAPHAETIAALEAADRGETVKVGSVEELFEELHRD
jgi:hypothetical protein